MNTETWVDITKYESLYAVSNFGRVKSKARNLINTRGIPYNRPSKINKALPTSRGYVRAALYKDGKTKYYSIHRLVAQAFIPNSHNKEEVNHKDGNKLNNCVTNLEWNTRGENERHARANGFKNMVGENHPNSLFTNNQVKSIRNVKKYTDLTVPQIAHLLDRSKHTISSIIARRGWTHLEDER